MKIWHVLVLTLADLVCKKDFLLLPILKKVVLLINFVEIESFFHDFLIIRQFKRLVFI